MGAAVAELVDNAIQAHATHIRIIVRDQVTSAGRSIMLSVLDDGHGMSPSTLQSSLQFGGSSRFGERTGLGRFGMGLPNSSVSQTRRVEVYSWQAGGESLFTYLDVDEIAAGKLRAIPQPQERELPAWANAFATTSGTLIEWTRCDRLNRLKAPTIAQRLRSTLGRLYRFPIWEGTRITVNDSRVAPLDPLFLHPTTPLSGATQFGSPLRYEFATPTKEPAIVEVRFSELPVVDWHDFNAGDKRRLGIIGRGGISFVRAGREIDYGWHLMGTKRRENYDDWWRCEVRFSPYLDELFGVTHSKQGITPSTELRAVLEPDLESIARVLNRRVREAFERAKASAPSKASRAATAIDQYLPSPAVEAPRRRVGGGFRYRIQVSSFSTPDFFRTDLVHGTILVTLNRNHPFVASVYLPLAEEESREKYNIECILFAAARADLEAVGDEQRQFLSRVRRSWADALAALVDR